MNVWESLKKPFFVLAPMDDVTDTTFRRVIADTAAPDMFFTEFVNADGLNSPGRGAVLQKLRFNESEKPLIAQIWGMQPDNFEKATSEIAEMGFDGVDLNMGCPVKNVVKLGACSALINDREHAAKLIQAAQKGANNKIPVSVKTRVGFNEIDMDWIEFLLRQQIDVLTIHGRTSKQQSKVPNNWNLIQESRKIRDRVAPDTLIIGNGDVLTRKQGEDLAEEHGLDGIMIGRGILQDPYVFSDKSPWEEKTADEKLELYKKHINFFREEWTDKKNPAGLKKFAKVYISGFDGASDLRAKLMDCNTASELLKVLNEASTLAKTVVL